jgi:thiamine-monophosphate kinase
MMDLSDGLATDLSHLCKQSGCGAVVHAVQLPSLPALDDAAYLLKKDPLELMIRGGEDYELLFTAPADAAPQITLLSEKSGVVVTYVGTIVDRQGVRLVLPASDSGEQKEVDISFGGFDHFPDQ